MVMKLTEIHGMILDLLVEDSYGLWEIVGRFNDLFPESSESEVAELARTAVEDLVDAGLVSVWFQPELSGAEELVPPARISEELRDPINWACPPDNHVNVRILATDLGVQAYYGNDWSCFDGRSHSS
jgi:hypothetical protein